VRGWRTASRAKCVSNPTAPNNIKPIKYSTLQTSDLIDLPVYYKTADTNSYERNEALTKRNQWVEPKLANNQPTRLMSATRSRATGASLTLNVPFST
jgi:hypothetical protein